MDGGGETADGAGATGSEGAGGTNGVPGTEDGTAEDGVGGGGAGDNPGPGGVPGTGVGGTGEAPGVGSAEPTLRESFSVSTTFSGASPSRRMCMYVFRREMVWEARSKAMIS